MSGKHGADVFPKNCGNAGRYHRNPFPGAGKLPDHFPEPVLRPEDHLILQDERAMKRGVEEGRRVIIAPAGAVDDTLPCPRTPQDMLLPLSWRMARGDCRTQAWIALLQRWSIRLIPAVPTAGLTGRPAPYTVPTDSPRAPASSPCSPEASPDLTGNGRKPLASPEYPKRRLSSPPGGPFRVQLHVPRRSRRHLLLTG